MLFSTIFILAFVGINDASAELDDLRELAFANNNFTLKIQKSFDAQGNILYCALSVFIALGMLYQGARDTTAQEMFQALSYDVAELKDKNLERKFKELLLFFVNSPNEDYRLDIANIMLSQNDYPVSTDYKEILKNSFDAILREVDFANDAENLVQEINEWVSNKTEGKIEKFLESLDANVVLVILNACYFKSTWQVEFSLEKTRNETFYNNGLDPVVVPMMKGDEHMFYMEEDHFKALKLFYKGGGISMVLLLPKERNGLSQLEQELTADKLDRIMSEMTNSSVFFSIPKFKLEYSISMNKPLVELGMVSAFDNRANFSGISEVGGIKVSGVLHKAFLEVNEEGSEAAGATGVILIPVSFPGPYIPDFRAEHPFLFFIMEEKTGIILFCGRVTELPNFI